MGATVTRRPLMIAAPIVAVLTLMLGLRIGAGEKVESAQVIAAAPGKATAAGTPYAWQLLTYLEDQGVRETVAMTDLALHARGSGGEARWTGASNADGIAEATFALPGSGPVDVTVTRAGVVLAEGRVVVPDRITATRAARARPTRLGGAPIDVLVEGERLVVGFPSTVWAHAEGEVRVTPEPGLLVEAKPGCAGWTEITATAQAHVVGIDIAAEGGASTWFGVLPVAPGAFFVDAPRSIAEGAPLQAVLVAPNPRNVVYAEIDDESGRVQAAALDVKVEPGDPTPRARWSVPSLAPGLHWLVVSGEPRGAETLAGAAVAKPFVVGRAPSLEGECALGPWLAQHAAAGFPRVLAIDGMATRGAKNRARHRAGLALGLVALLSAAVLETLLLLRASRESRLALGAALDDEPAPKSQGSVAVALLVALLGFAFLAVLLVAKA